nr:immunoglobulin heavy chain junction region [Mus musculus]MBK4186335.1 immunoglobulin heavy chain junction region [Mus musculus]
CAKEGEGLRRKTWFAYW